MAYADPPYPTLARRYYRLETSYRGEVDHAALVRRLLLEYPEGWALSTSAKALRFVLPLCPASARVCSWVKPNGIPPRTRGPHSRWEALIVWGGRADRAVRDTLVASPARGGGKLKGRKPLAFVRWMFALLGLRPGDELDDLFPGTGIVGRAWREVSRGAGAGESDTSRRTSEALSDMSLAAGGVLGDASPRDVACSDDASGGR